MSTMDGSERWQDYRLAGKSAFAKAEYTEAESSWSLALEESRKFGTEDPRLIRSLLDLARVYQVQDKLDEAEPLFKEAIEVTEKTAGSDNSKLAVILNNLGTLYSAQGKPIEQEEAYRRSLCISINAYGLFHETVATCLNNMAELCRVQGRFQEAEPIYKYVLAIYEYLDPDSPYVANVLHNLATLLCARGRYLEAKPVLKKALALEKPESNKALFREMRTVYEELVERTRGQEIWMWLTGIFNPGQ